MHTASARPWEDESGDQREYSEPLYVHRRWRRQRHSAGNALLFAFATFVLLYLGVNVVASLVGWKLAAILTIALLWVVGTVQFFAMVRLADTRSRRR